MMVDRILLETHEEFPSFRLVEKRGWFWKLISFLIIVFTLGKVRCFNQFYVTTVGPIIAVPEGWKNKVDDQMGYLVLYHERVHMRQFKRFGFGSPWLGILPMGLAYLLLPLPFGLAWCRYAFEREAYLAQACIAAEMYGKSIGYQYVEHAVEQLTGASYGWSWPFPRAVRKWFEARL